MDTVTSTDRKQRVLESFCYPVALRPSDKPGKQDVFRVDTGRVISNVSNRYELIENRRVLMPFVEKFGVDKMQQLFTHQAGRSFYMSIDTGREFDLGEGDIIKERFIVQNSYDKTRSFRFELGAFRKVCTNGLYTVFAGVNFRKIHVGNIPVEQLINRGLEVFTQNSFEFWRKLKTIPLTAAEGTALVNDFEPYEVKERHANRWEWTEGEFLNNQTKARAARNIEAPESLDNQRNAWGVYNQVNRAIASYNDRSNIGRVISANVRLEQFLAGKLNLN